MREHASEKKASKSLPFNPISEPLSVRQLPGTNIFREHFVCITSGGGSTFSQLVCNSIVCSVDVPEVDLATMSALSFIDLCIQLAE